METRAVNRTTMFTREDLSLVATCLEMVTLAVDKMQALPTGDLLAVTSFVGFPTEGVEEADVRQELGTLLFRVAELRGRLRLEAGV